MGSNGQAVGKGKGKGKMKAKLEKFPWTDDLVVKLLNCLKEYHRVNGYGQGFDWATVNNDFAKAHGFHLPPGVAKNKTEHMKKQWRHWVELRFTVTGGGWDPATGKVTMSDEWWDRQDKTSLDKYRVFRKRGVNPEISNLWDDVYANIVASGKNVMSPTMDHSAARALICAQTDEGLNSNGVSGMGGGGRTSGLDQIMDEPVVDPQFRSMVAQVRVDVPDDELLASIHDTITTPITGDAFYTSGNASQSQQLDDTNEDTPTGRKKRKRPSMAAIALNEHMAHVGKTGDRILSLMEGEMGSTNNPGGERPVVYTFADCQDVLRRMVATKLIEDCSELWCIGVSKLAKESNRNVFMSLDSDEQRVVWLKFELKALGLRLAD